MNRLHSHLLNQRQRDNRQVIQVIQVERSGELVAISGPAAQRATRRLVVGAVLLGVLLGVLYAFFVRTELGQLVDDLAYSGRRALGSRYHLLDERVLNAVSITAIAIVLFGLLTVGVWRHVIWRGLFTVTAFVTAVAAAEILKRVLPRPGLLSGSEAVGVGLVGNSYPSGHTTIAACSSLAIMLMIGSRWRPWAAVGAGAVSALYATAVLFAGWHRAADALGGLALTGISMSLAGAAAIYVERGQLERSSGSSPDTRVFRYQLLLAAVVSAVMTALAWVVAAARLEDYPDADPMFMAFTLLIIGASFGLATWFGRAIRLLR